MRAGWEDELRRLGLGSPVAWVWDDDIDGSRCRALGAPRLIARLAGGRCSE